MNFYDLCMDIYSIISILPRFSFQTPKKTLPSNGIYLFFEQGETIDNNLGRIVRIGTHKADGRFPKRIRQHYGNISSLKGNKNSSVFRKHLGGAMLRKVNDADPRLNDWLTQDGPTFQEVEENVSKVLRERFTFSCFHVENKGVFRKRFNSAFSAIFLGTTINKLAGQLCCK